jgi:hypothetical protein
VTYALAKLLQGLFLPANHHRNTLTFILSLSSKVEWRNAYSSPCLFYSSSASILLSMLLWVTTITFTMGWV